MSADRTRHFAVVSTLISVATEGRKTSCTSASGAGTKLASPLSQYLRSVIPLSHSEYKAGPKSMVSRSLVTVAPWGGWKGGSLGGAVNGTP